MNEISIISGVECYEKDGTIYLKLETVAKGLGFTKTDIKNGKEYVRIDWNRVEGFLGDIGFGNQFPKDSYIPENIFYRLAMKAKNEAAEAFQAKVADEIIPSIRKTGSYSAIDRSKLSDQMQMFYALADHGAMLEMEQKRLDAAQKEQAEQIIAIETRMDNMKDIFTVSMGDWQKDINTMVAKIAISAKIGFQELYNKLYDQLEIDARVSLQRRIDSKIARMTKAGNTKTTIKKATTKLAIIADDAKLRTIFENIVKKWAMAYCA